MGYKNDDIILVSLSRAPAHTTRPERRRSVATRRRKFTYAAHRRRRPKRVFPFPGRPTRAAGPPRQPVGSGGSPSIKFPVRGDLFARDRQTADTTTTSLIISLFVFPPCPSPVRNSFSPGSRTVPERRRNAWCFLKSSFPFFRFAVVLHTRYVCFVFFLVFSPCRSRGGNVIRVVWRVHPPSGYRCC